MNTTTTNQQRSHRASLLLICTDPGRAAAVGTEIASCGVAVNVIASLQDLAATDLTSLDLAISDMELPDGTGIDALAYIQAARQSLPVVLTMQKAENALIEEAIHAGALDCVVRDDGWRQRIPLLVSKWLAQRQQHTQIERMHLRLNTALTELVDEISELQSMIGKLEAIAVTDELTGLNNRRRLSHALDHQWAERSRIGESVAFLMIDVDRFKLLNDRFGHQRGDALLCLLGRVLHENCRNGDIIARYGGDEFCVLMPSVSVEDATATAQRISAAFREATLDFARDGIDLSLSIGVAHTDLSRPSHPMQLIEHADEAMYIAKRCGDAVMTRNHTGVLPAVA
ncbi:MAG: GGDEF domain-containing protein [Phycisphaerales bacterium]